MMLFYIFIFISLIFIKISGNELFYYVLSPLFMILSYLLFNFKFKQKNRKTKNNLTTLIIILGFYFIFSYFLLSIITDLVKTTLDNSFKGIILNVFPLIIGRIVLENFKASVLNLRKNKIYLIIIVLLISVIYFFDFNESIISFKFINILFLEILLLYINYISGKNASIYFYFIITLPIYIISYLPNMDIAYLSIFNIVSYLIIFLIINYYNIKGEKNIPKRLTKEYSPVVRIGILGGIFLIISFNLGLFKIKPVVILSKSMSPTLNVADLVIIKETNFNEVKKNDIIEFNNKNVKIIHRIVDIKNNMIITKGDANKDLDKEYVTEEDIIGKYLFKIPFVGYPSYIFNQIKNIIKIKGA